MPEIDPKNLENTAKIKAMQLAHNLDYHSLPKDEKRRKSKPQNKPIKRADLRLRFIADFIDVGIFVALAINWNWIGPIVGAAYLLFRDAFKGRSLGKLLVGLRVVKMDNWLPAGVTESISRNLVLAISGLFAILGGMGFGAFGVVLVVLTVFVAMQINKNPDGRHLGDQLAGTKLLETRTAAALKA